MNKIDDKQLLQALAIKGASLGSLGKMCDDCAFKKGTDANNDENAVAAATTCLWDEGPPHFNCHTKEFTDADTPCKGYQYAMQWLTRLESTEEKNHIKPLIKTES